MHYLDNASTTKVSTGAAEAVMDAMTIRFGNPSSVHSMGIEAENIVEDARKELAASLNCKPNEILFTSGGTESNNIAILQTANLMQRQGRHILSTAIEHPSVANTIKYLGENGFDVTFVAPEKNGKIDPERIVEAIRPDTILVSMMLCNNETGALQPVADVVKLVRPIHPDIIFHTDAVQAYMKYEFDVQTLGVDMLSVSSHKIHGPKGAGALYVRNGIRLKPMSHGGGQESGLRSGTEAGPAIAGFGVAVREANQALKSNIDHVSHLRESLLKGIEKLSGVTVIAAEGAIVNIAVPKYPTEVLIRMLESRGIFVSGGSACNRGKSSTVLEAMRVNPRLIKSSIRISFSKDNTDDDIDALVEALKDLS
jgi:cysteine desulfurase